jgi:hypothetical protein
MWHWNSWWAPAAGDPPAVDDPNLWRTPWSIEQALAFQARSWETWVSASQSWWAVALSTWPLALPVAAAKDEATPSATVHRLPPPRKRPPAKRSRAH